MLLPYGLFRRRLRPRILAGLASAAVAIWMLLLSGRRQDSSPRFFDARMLEERYPLVWKHIHSFDGTGTGGGKLFLVPPLDFCGVRIWWHSQIRLPELDHQHQRTSRCLYTSESD